MIVSILIFLIMFSVIVISHEFGHYAIARRNGAMSNTVTTAVMIWT